MYINLKKIMFFVLQMLRKKLHPEIKHCHCYAFKSTYYKLKTKSFALTLVCSVKGCNVIWKGYINKDKIELSRTGQRNHQNADANRRTRIGRSDSGKIVTLLG